MRAIQIPGDRRSGDEAGFALIFVILMAAVLLILGLLAFGDIGYNQTSSRGVNAQAQADNAAEVGLSTAKYDISILNTTSAISATPISSTGAPANTPTSTYSVTVTYYTTPTPNGSSIDSCGSTSVSGTVTICNLASTPQSATIVATGVANVAGTLTSTNTFTGGTTATAVVQEQISIASASANSYVVFAGSALTTTVNNQLTVGASSGSPPTLGEFYVDGNFSTGTAGCATAINATLVAAGNLTLDNCTVDGSVAAAGNIFLQNAASVGASSTNPANATASNGSIVMDGSKIYGNAVTRGTSTSNIELCGPNASYSPCTVADGMPATPDKGGSIIYGSAASAGAVYESQTSEPNSPSPCTAVPASPGTDKNQIQGCITTQDTANTANLSASLGMPTISAPTAASNPWNGYTLDPNANCNTGTDPNSVYNLLASSTPQVIVVGSGCSGPLLFSGIAGNKITLKANMAVFDASGFNILTNFVFAPVNNKTNIQLSLIVPNPTGSYSCGTASAPSYSITLNGNHWNTAPSMQQPPGTASPTPKQLYGLFTYLYSPCYIQTTSGGAAAPTVYGETMADYYSFLNSSGQVKGQLSVYYNPFAPPGLTWGYVVQTEQRFVVQP